MKSCKLWTKTFITLASAPNVIQVAIVCNNYGQKKSYNICPWTQYYCNDGLDDNDDDESNFNHQSTDGILKTSVDDLTIILNITAPSLKIADLIIPGPHCTKHL